MLFEENSARKYMRGVADLTPIPNLLKAGLGVTFDIQMNIFDNTLSN